MKTIFFKLVLPLIGVFALLGVITALPVKPTQARTYLDKVGRQAQTYSCGPATFHIGVKENPSCSSGTVNGLTTYQSSVDMMLDNAPDNVQYKIDWNWTSYYCDKPWDGNVGCLSNPDPQTGTTMLQKNSYVIVSSHNRSLPNACGGFQNDFAFTASYSTDGGKNWTAGCSGGDLSNPGARNATWTYCSSNINTCSNPTPTPTTPVTPTPTTPVTPTTTPTVTPTTTPTVCTTPPTCTTPPAGCSYQGADACTCGQLVCITTIPGCTGSDCNITVNVNQSQTQTQQQQQQQQMVLAATVAPATSTQNLPSTGAGFQVLGTLFALIPAGWKLRRLV